MPTWGLASQGSQEGLQTTRRPHPSQAEDLLPMQDLVVTGDERNLLDDASA